MTRVDLDIVQHLLDVPMFVDGVPVLAIGNEDLAVLVAELRLARAVVAAARVRPNATRALREALAAYDQERGS